MHDIIYLNVDECQIASSMQQQRFKQQTSLNYAIIPENVVSERVVALKIEYHANAKYENPLKFSEKNSLCWSKVNVNVSNNGKT